MERGVAKGLALGGGVLAAHVLLRRRDNVAATPALDEAEAAVREGMVPPCGVAREGGELGATFEAEWSIQARSLSAEFGRVLGDELPAVTAECAAAWVDLWLRAWWTLRSSGQPIRWAAFGNIAQEATIQAWDEVPPTTGALFLYGDAVKWTRVGRAWAALVKDRTTLLWFVRSSKRADEPGKVYLHARQVASNLREFALALDEAARAELAPSAGEYVKNGARALGRGVGNALAFTIEEVLSPVIGSVSAATFGALVSSGGPYILLGGAAWWLLRRRA